MKKNGVLIVIFLIIGLSFGCIGGYLYRESKEEKPIKRPDTVVESKEQALDLSNTELTDTMSKITTMSCNKLQYYYFLEKEKVTIKDISNETAMMFIDYDYYGFVDENTKSKIKKGEDGTEYIEVSEDEVLEKIQKRFGSDYKFEHKTYEDAGPAKFEYDKDKKQYKVILYGFGCTGPANTSIAQITKAYKKDDKMVVTYRVLYGEDILDNPTSTYYSKYYKDYNKKTPVSKDDINYTGNGYTPNLMVANDQYLPNYSLGSEYEFTFKKDGSEYVFVSSELK